MNEIALSSLGVDIAVMLQVNAEHHFENKANEAWTLIEELIRFPYYRMIPLAIFPGYNFAMSGRVGPLYAACLFADVLIIDEQTRPFLRRKDGILFRQVIEFLDALQSSGRLKEISYQNILYKKWDLVENEVRRQIKYPRNWGDAIINAEDWRVKVHHGSPLDYVLSRLDDRISAYYREEPFVDNILKLAMSLPGGTRSLLKLWKKELSKPYRRLYRATVESYLYHVNSMRILSNEIGVPMIDWPDTKGFYLRSLDYKEDDTKLLEVSDGQILLNLLFPCFKPKNANKFVKSLDRPEIEEFRKIIRNEKHVDEALALEIIRNILDSEIAAGFRHSITGFATLPLGFIPYIGTPIQKGAEVAINHFLNIKNKKRHGWFHIFADLLK